jgi:hypothetical protein
MKNFLNEIHPAVARRDLQTDDGRRTPRDDRLTSGEPKMKNKRTKGLTGADMGEKT